MRKYYGEDATVTHHQFLIPKHIVPELLSRRERPESAPYLRLKNSKRTSKCQSIFFYGTGKPRS